MVTVISSETTPASPKTDVGATHRTSILTDIPWVRTTAGSMTVRDVLLRAGDIKGLDTDALNGMEYMTTLRILEHLAVVALRHQDDQSSGDIEPAAIERAIGLIEPYADLFDDRSPALQVRRDTTSFKPSPPDWDRAMPQKSSGMGSLFWNLTSRGAENRDLSRITLNLAVNAFYGTSNNGGGLQKGITTDGVHVSYAVFKPRPESVAHQGDDEVTEVALLGTTLAQSLLLGIPTAWVADCTSLPGWLDTRAETGQDDFWWATWSVCSTATQWSWEAGSGRLVSAQRSGIAPRSHIMDITPCQEPTGDQIQAWQGFVETMLTGTESKLANANTGRTKDVKTLKAIEGYRRWDPHRIYKETTADQANENGTYTPDVAALGPFTLPADTELGASLVDWAAADAAKVFISRSTGTIGILDEVEQIAFHRYTNSTSKMSKGVIFSRIDVGTAAPYLIHDERLVEAGNRALTALDEIRRLSAPTKSSHPIEALHQSLLADATATVSAWSEASLSAPETVLESLQPLLRALIDLIRRSVDTASPATVSQVAQRAGLIARRVSRALRGASEIEINKEHAR